MLNQRNRGIWAFIYNYIGRFISQVISFFVSIYVIRQIPVAVYGDYLLLGSILSYCSLFASLGLTGVFQRYIPDFTSEKQDAGISFLVFTGLAARLVIGVLLVILVFVFSGPIGTWLNFPNLGFYFNIYAFVIVLNLLVTLLDVALTSLLRQLVTNTSLLVYNLLRGIGFFLVIQQGLGLRELLVVELVSNLLRLLILSFGLHNYLPKWQHITSQSRTLFDIPRLAKYGLWAYFNDVSYMFFNTDTDNFIISNQLGSSYVGIYGFANRIAAMITEWSPISVGANVITPLFFERYARSKDPLELDRLFGLINKLVYLFFIPVLMIVALLNIQLITLVFGNKYLEASWLLIGVLFYQVVNAYQFPLGLVVFALEKNQYNFYSRIFSLYNLAADLILVNIWGVAGILIATASAITLKNLFIYWKISRLIKLNWDWKGYTKIFINAFASALVCWIFRSQAQNVLTMLILILISGILYLGFTYLNIVFSQAEVIFINGLFRRKILPEKRMA